MPKPAAKRFYKHAASAWAASGFTVELDGRPVRTPVGNPLMLESEALAVAVAAEWEAQGDNILPHSMPLSGLACAAIDRVGPERVAVTSMIASYATTDLLCYRDDSPSELAERQHTYWQPLLEWAESDLDARMAVTEGIVPVQQPEKALLALQTAVDALDDFELTALASVTASTGSLIIGLALVRGCLTADQAFQISQIDEHFQAERWGEDAEAQDRCKVLENDIRTAALFLDLWRG
ncbi:MAG: ATPase [Rhodospirillales bacterium]|nr:ATPase [Rhodospirillales bacterium]